MSLFSEKNDSQDSLKDFYEDSDISRSSEISGSDTSLYCRRRKQPHPTKALPLDDPDFRGVIITMSTKKEGQQWKFIVKATYKTSKPRARRSMNRRRRRGYQDSPGMTDSTGDDEEVPIPPVNEKQCASCDVKKTPLWRDAEDGTPLCNACGIRYKKYKIRCTNCWHIPKKDEFSPNCKTCGSNFQCAQPKTW